MTQPLARRWAGNMAIFPIPEALTAAYKGSGHALAAVKGGELVDLLYLRDLLPDFKPGNVEDVVNNVRLAPSINHLSSLGDVSVGMCSCWEFCEL